MARVIAPLAQMGAAIGSQQGLPPLQIEGGRELRGIDYRLPVASAQVKSAILLAGLYADGATTVREPHPTRDYTESMLAAFGVPVSRQGNAASVSGGARLRGRRLQIPADFSSAAFFMVAASLVPGSDLRINGVGLNPRRCGLLTTLIEMGADIEISQQCLLDGEPVGDLRVRSAALRGVTVPLARVPDMIDEFPILFVAAALADGETLIEGAAELRVKESDRIGVMARALTGMGAEIEERADGVRITGVPALRAADVDAATDHRCAMSLAVAALCASGRSRIRQIDNVVTSFPGFEALATGVGFDLARNS
jgi:3-phosphoshikimate 1-carboxyvinyltransferase